MTFKFSTQEDPLETHDINITPFIDVMLVLLIIFMVVAPLATVDIRVDLPASQAAGQPQPEQPHYLTLKQDGSLFLDNQPLLGKSLREALQGVALDHPLFIRADRNVSYERLIAVLDDLRTAGYLKIGLITTSNANP